MNKIKKGMMELEENKNESIKNYSKIVQEQDPERMMRQHNSSTRPSSVASSTSLNFGPQRPQIKTNGSRYFT